jgi:exonuclease SbcC
MRISYLELRNYRRFKELKLQFPDGIVGILGLNGSGKTTIIEGMAWALFGNVDEVVRTNRESVKRIGSGSGEHCMAVLEFELGGTDYRIEREMGGKSLTMRAELRSGSTVVATGDKPVKKAVEKLIGMDHKSFFTSVFARQKELNALQNVAAGERKKVVLRMLRIDGVDAVVQLIRTDARDIKERIKGAESTLVDEDGRDRQSVLSDRLPKLQGQREEAEGLLKEAEAKEAAALKAVDEARSRRDLLKKDVDAYNSSSRDLTAKRSAISELRKREERLAARVADAKKKLDRLPELESAEKAWSENVRSKDALEAERSKGEKAKHLAEDIAVISKDETRAVEEISKLRAALTKPSDIVGQIDELEKARSESEAAKAEISGRIGELKAKRKERGESAAKDAKKLSEIEKVGKEGVCPTCERTLEDAYELLIDKLRESSESASKSAEEAAKAILALEGELQGLARKDEAFRKKRTRLDQELTMLRQAEASVEGAEKELARVRARLLQKRTDLSGLGEVRFSEQEYARVRAEHERLKPLHDEFVRVRGVQEELGRSEHELGDVRDTIQKNSMEEGAIRSLVDVLEPKKAQYELIIKELDDKMAVLNSAKDHTRKLLSAREAAKAEHDRVTKELENIARVKKNIESEQKRAEALAMLDSVMVSFRDHLIGKVAPALSELTSKIIDSMTDGKYSRIELGDDYEIQVDDQGEMHPIARFSGGEMDLANLGLRLAISRIIAERTGANPINFLILDEIFGSLDPNRKRSVMTALTNLSSQFRQMFLITHIEDIKDLMNYVIRVEEAEDGTSKATLVT